MFTTVLEQGGPVITFSPDLSEEGVCAKMVDGMKTGKELMLRVVRERDLLVKPFTDELLELSIDMLGANVKVDVVELINLVGSFSLFRKRRIEPRESIRQSVEDSRSMHDGKVVLEKSIGPVVEHLGFMRTSEQIRDGGMITKKREFLSIEPVSKLGDGKDHCKQFSACGRIVHLRRVEGFAGERNVAVLTLIGLVENGTHAMLASVGGNHERQVGVCLRQCGGLRKHGLDQVKGLLAFRRPFDPNDLELAQLFEGCADACIERHVIAEVVGHAKERFDLLASFGHKKTMEACNLVRIRLDGITRNDVSQDGELRETEPAFLKVETE